MLGWQIYIATKSPEELPAGPYQTDYLLASWTTGLNGIDWLTALVKEGKAIEPSNGGYPWQFAAKASVILPLIADGPPTYTGKDVIGDDYYIPVGWIGEGRFNAELAAKCLPDDMLYIDAWDQS